VPSPPGGGSYINCTKAPKKKKCNTHAGRPTQQELAVFYFFI